MKFKALLLLVFVALVACSNIEAGQVNDLSAEEGLALIEKNNGNPDFIILDIRTPREYRQGHIPGAISIDYYNPNFKSNIDRLDRGKTYLIYCRSGNRTGRSLKIFAELGFLHIYHLKGGIIDWQANKYELSPFPN